MMFLSQVKVGAKFRDAALSSQPSEYQVHEVTEIEKDSFHARHLASNNLRTWARSQEAITHLELISPIPDLHASADCLVGRKLKIKLEQGSTTSGLCTAVVYRNFKLNGEPYRQLLFVELDKSGSTRYRLDEINAIDFNDNL